MYRSYYKVEHVRYRAVVHSLEILICRLKSIFDVKIEKLPNPFTIYDSMKFSRKDNRTDNEYYMNTSLP